MESVGNSSHRTAAFSHFKNRTDSFAPAAAPAVFLLPTPCNTQSSSLSKSWTGPFKLPSGLVTCSLPAAQPTQSLSLRARKLQRRIQVLICEENPGRVTTEEHAALGYTFPLFF